MVDVDVIRVQWVGLNTGAHVSTFYSNAATAPDLHQIGILLNSIKSLVPQEVTFHIPNSGDRIDATTGVLTGSWTSPLEADNIATGAGSFAAPVGGVIEWRTGTIVAGRLLKGKTYVVPMIGSAFTAAGIPTSAAVAQLQAAADAFAGVSTQTYGIYRKAHVTTVKDPRPAYAGTFALIQTARVPNLAAVLRKRRG